MSFQEFLLERGWIEQPPYHRNAGMWFNAQVDDICFTLEEAYRVELAWQKELAKEDPDKIKLCPKCGRTWEDS